MVLAHPIAGKTPHNSTASQNSTAAPDSTASQEGTTAVPKCAVPPAGGMLFGCQDREFGRSRRAARLYTLPLLYVGTDGFLRSAVGCMRSKVPLADGEWHRVTLTMSLSEDHSTTLAGMACLFVDGCLDDVTRQWDFPGFPSYPVLGSGITEGHRYGDLCHVGYV